MKSQAKQQLVQYFLGWLSPLDICNQLLVISYRPGEVIMAPTSLVEAAAIRMRKTGIKCIWTT